MPSPFWFWVNGTTKLKRLEENIQLTGVEPSEGDLRELDDSTAGIAVEGDRYPPELERYDEFISMFFGRNASSWCFSVRQRRTPK